MILDERFPSLRVGGLDPGQQVFRKHRARPVVTGGTDRMHPTMGGKVFANLDLETGFLVEAHGAQGRTDGLKSTASKPRDTCRYGLHRWKRQFHPQLAPVFARVGKIPQRTLDVGLQHFIRSIFG